MFIVLHNLNFFLQSTFAKTYTSFFLNENFLNFKHRRTTHLPQPKIKSFDSNPLRD